MPAYPNDPSPRHSRDRRQPPDYDDDDDLYRRPKPRDPYGEPRTNGRDRRREKYDASDEDDDPRRGSRDHGSKAKKSSRSPDIPPPPIGSDRGVSAGRKSEPEVNGKYGQDGAYSRRKSLGSHHSEEKTIADDADKPQRRKSTRHADLYDDNRDLKKSARPRDSHDDDFERRRRSHKPRDNDRYDDLDVPRRSKPLPMDDDTPKRKPSRRDGDPRRSRPSYPGDDTEPEYERPRRTQKPSKHDDYYSGYGTDRPRRQPRDDYDRGYRTDGRESKRDRHRGDGRRDDRHRGDYDDYDHHRHGGGGRRKKSGGHNLGEMMEKGQKNWKKVEPVAKPLLTQLAQAYLHNAGGH